jgi:hypothetical protein
MFWNVPLVALTSPVICAVEAYKDPSCPTLNGAVPALDFTLPAQNAHPCPDVELKPTELFPLSLYKV